MIHVDKTDGQIRLKEIVFDVMEDLGLEPRWWKNILRWVIRGVGELHLFHMNYYEEEKLTPSDLNIITVPDDFVSLVALGINYKGRFWRLSQDNRFITTTTTDGDDEILDEDIGEGVAMGDSIIYHLGDSGGKNQYYLTWLNRSQFMINGTPRVDVMMRYVSSGVNKQGSTYVPAICREALIAWAKKMYYERIATSDLKIMRSQEKYETEVEKLRFIQFASNEDIADAIYESWTQTVKR